MVPYKKAWDLQKRIAAAIHEGQLHQDVILLLEHPQVFTVGRRGGKENLLVSENFLREKGIPVLQIERGGNITFHGPGQMVCYPILRLKKSGFDIPGLVYALESVMIKTALEMGVASGRNCKNPGIWVGNKKLGSVGLAIRHGITFHGFALNVNIMLDPFSWINPCGFSDVQMTSIKNETGKEISMDTVRETIAISISSEFSVRLVKKNLDTFYNMLPEKTDPS